MSTAAVNRFVLTDRAHADNSRGRLDGAWWPASTDLAAELPQLVEDVTHAGMSLDRVTYRIEDWPTTSVRRLVIAGRLVHLAGYHRQAPGTLSVSRGSDRRRLDLLLIPSNTDEATARHQLDEARNDRADDGTPGLPSSADAHPGAWVTSSRRESAASARAR